MNKPHLNKNILTFTHHAKEFLDYCLGPKRYDLDITYDIGYLNVYKYKITRKGVYKTPKRFPDEIREELTHIAYDHVPASIFIEWEFS